MKALDLERLKGVIDANEEHPCRIRFDDGEEFEVNLGHWWQDSGEQPTADATVVTVINSKRDWKAGAAITFDLNSIVRISDTKSERTFFETN